MANDRNDEFEEALRELEEGHGSGLAPSRSPDPAYPTHDAMALAAARLAGAREERERILKLRIHSPGDACDLSLARIVGFGWARKEYGRAWNAALRAYRKRIRETGDPS